MRVGVCVLQGQEGVGGDGALAFALGARQQVVDGQLRGGEGDGRNLGLQLLEVLLLLHQLVEGLLLLLEEEGGGQGEAVKRSARADEAAAEVRVLRGCVPLRAATAAAAGFDAAAGVSAAPGG